MIIGVPKELKTRENRVGIVPGGVKVLTAAGHNVLIEKSAGEGVGISDSMYEQAGAKILASPDELWASCDLVMKVKEPISAEFPRLRKGQILYTYLHLAAEPALTKALLEKNVTSIAYETIQLADGSLPLLKPMSEVAGRMSVQIGANCLQQHNGGKGLLLGGVPGVRRGRVAIIGGGVSGLNAAKIAVGLGAEVTVLDTNQARLAYLDDVFFNQITTLMSNPENIAKTVTSSDLVISAVLLAGAKAPMIVTKEMVRAMEPGSVIVDIAIDQGGSVETIKPTTHDNPIYQWEGINHYAVTNIPGDVPKTSTYALTNVTLPYALELANKGLEKALSTSKPLSMGLNTHEGCVTHEAVARAHQLPFQPLQ